MPSKQRRGGNAVPAGDYFTVVKGDERHPVLATLLVRLVRRAQFCYCRSHATLPASSSYSSTMLDFQSIYFDCYALVKPLPQVIGLTSICFKSGCKSCVFTYDIMT